ncbi:MAG: ATP-binding cassette domain-containing protein [Alphaproteobacteria bacterium]|nr:ATP-binding cassette domain-containing protein [Alphaproteobacteria bacterium]
MGLTNDDALSPLRISSVSASYGKVQVLSDINFELKDGEVFGLIGLNGAGKTTLIRSILSLGQSIGAVDFYGQPNHEALSRRQMIYLPEKFMPAPQLSGWEHLSLLLSYFDQKIDKDRAKFIAAGLGFPTEALDRRVRTYSKGMGQKLGLIGVVLAKVPLMILDEPMSGLDPRSRVLLKDRLLEARGEGRTVFFSSHILADIEEICNRIGIIHGGRLIFLGTPGDFIAQYESPNLERAFLTAIDQSDAAQSNSSDRAA